MITLKVIFILSASLLFVGMAAVLILLALDMLNDLFGIDITELLRRKKGGEG